MKVLVGKKTHTVKVYRGDVESAKKFLGPWDKLRGELKYGVSVEHKKEQWKLLDDLADAKKAEPGDHPSWEKTEFEIGSFTGTPLDPIEDNKLIKKYTKYEKVKGQVLPETDFAKIKIEKLKRVISGWDLKNDTTEESVPCTDEMKEIVYLCNPDVIDDALSQFGTIGRTGENKEEELKN